MVTRILSTFHQWKAMAGPLPCPASQATIKWAAFSSFHSLSIYPIVSVPRLLFEKITFSKGPTCFSNIYCCGCWNPCWGKFGWWGFLLNEDLIDKFLLLLVWFWTVSFFKPKDQQQCEWCQTGCAVGTIFLAKASNVDLWIPKDRSKAKWDLRLIILSCCHLFLSSCLLHGDFYPWVFPSDTLMHFILFHTSMSALVVLCAQHIFKYIQTRTIHTYTPPCPVIIYFLFFFWFGTRFFDLFFY